MPTLVELEKKVKELEQQLQKECDKTTEVENEMKKLVEEVAQVKSELSKTSKPKKEVKLTEPTSNGHKTTAPIETKKSKPKEESSSSESSEEEDDDEEESSSALSDAKEVKRNEPQKGVSREGILEKKGAMRKIWQKRYFILNEKDKTLVYYQNKTDPRDNPKGVIPLTNATCYAHVEKKGQVKPLFFNIRTETRDILLKAEDAESKAEWVKAIKSNCIRGHMSPEQRKHLSKKPSAFIGKTQEEGLRNSRG